MTDNETLMEIADTLQDIKLQVERIADRLDDAASMAAICQRNAPPDDGMWRLSNGVDIVPGGFGTGNN